MSDRATRLLSLVALALASVALVVALLAMRRAEDRAQEIERLRGALERLSPAAPGTGSGPPLALDPGDD
jgi:hypothetical protein